MHDTFIVIDVETANSDRSSICQIGLTFVKEYTIIKSIGFLVDPQTSFAQRNTNIHGINNEHVKGKATFSERLKQLKYILEKLPIYQHSDFDRQAINAAVDKADADMFDVKWIDAIGIFKKIWPDQINKSYTLKSLCQKHAIPYGYHDASDDAQATALLLILAYTGVRHPPQQRIKLIPERKDKSIVFTGNFSQPKRKLERLAQNAGMQPKSNMNTYIAYLCVGKADHRTYDTGHNKTNKHRYGLELIEKGHPITLLDEDELYDLIEHAPYAPPS